MKSVIKQRRSLGVQSGGEISENKGPPRWQMQREAQIIDNRKEEKHGKQENKNDTNKMHST